MSGACCFDRDGIFDGEAGTYEVEPEAPREDEKIVQHADPGQVSEGGCDRCGRHVEVAFIVTLREWERLEWCEECGNKVLGQLALARVDWDRAKGREPVVVIESESEESE